MLEHGTPQQGSFGIEEGAFVVPEAPTPDDRSDLRQQLDAQAKDAAVAHAIGQTNRPYEVRESEVWADLGGQADRHPAPETHAIKTKGWSSTVGLVDTDGKVRAQIADNETVERSHAATQRAELDEDDRGRNRAGIAQARAAIPHVERETWDRSHVINEGDDTPAVAQQVGVEDLRQVPNRDQVAEQQRATRQSILKRGEQFMQPPKPEPYQGTERAEFHPINDAKRFLAGEKPEDF